MAVMIKGKNFKFTFKFIQKNKTLAITAGNQYLDFVHVSEISFN